MSKDLSDNTRALSTITADFAILAPTNANLAVNGTPRLEDLIRVSVPVGGGDTWEVQGISGIEAVSHLEGIILGHHDARALWGRPLEEGSPGAPPECSSADGITGVGDPGGNCRDCAFSRFGSASNGRGQACRLTLELVLARREDRIPLIVNVPPSSYRTIHGFILRLPVPHYMAVVRLGLSPIRQPGRIYSLIAPRFLGAIDPEHHDKLAGLHRLLAN
jgi:hypothetical protein